jgi:hypothetical protein
LNRRDLEELVSVSEWPCVSVIVPIERRAPASLANGTRVKSGLKRAARALKHEDLEPEEVRPIVARLDATARGLDLSVLGADGLGLYVSPTFARAVAFDFAVKERVVVDRVFATREVVLGLGLGVRWRALVLAPGHARVLEGFRDRLREIGGVGVSPALERAGESPAPLEAEQLPLVLVGMPEDTLPYAGRPEVIATVQGRHERDTPAELGARLWPSVAREIEARRRARLEGELDRGFKSRRIIEGIQRVSGAARAGEGELLLAEEDLPVDELVDDVISTGGTVELVPHGSLAAQGGVALLTRFPLAEAA